MKKFIPVVILAAGAQVGCERSGSCSAAYAAYQEFGKAVANERWDEAERMAASPDVSDWISARRRAVVFRGYKTLPSCRGMLHWGPVFKLVSETYLDGGARAILQVIQEERSGVYTLSLIHISEPTRLLSISYAVFCLKKKTQRTKKHRTYMHRHSYIHRTHT